MPTLGPGGIDTIVAQTAGAAATQTAALIPPSPTPTETPTATRTPTVTPSLTPTFLFILATRSKTPTPGASSSSGDFACSLISQSPADGATMKKNEAFTVTWKVKNTGAVTWDTNSVDFIYVSGAKLASVKVADLPNSVAVGDTIALKLGMNAPGANGTYKTVWTLHHGKTQFCKVNISIVVQ